MIKIKVSNLVNDRYEYDFEGKISEIDISEPYIGNFNTNVALSKFGNQIILDAETGIIANLICDRCTKEFHSLVTSKYRMIYLFRQKLEDAENENLELVYIHPGTDKIDISGDIRDYALLAVPMKKICSEDCKGLCFKCGKNLNDDPCNCREEKIDSRWEPLQKLK